MRSTTVPARFLPFVALAIGLSFAAAPAAAQWSQIPTIPTTNIYGMFANGDTIIAGADSVLYVSTNAGVTWQRTARVTSVVFALPAVWYRNGRIYAGAYGQGVFVSDNLGATWQAYNQGLTGGFQDSQLDVDDLQQRGDSLYAATAGAGVYVRGFGALDTWHHFGEDFEPNQASDVQDLALGGTRLLASAGPNGSMFWREPGDPEWTISWLNNVGLDPGLLARSAIWTGSSWLVGTNIGVFSSTLGQEPWAFFNPGLGALGNLVFAMEGRRAFGAFSNSAGAAMAFTDDDGANWHLLEGLPHVFVFKLAAAGNSLFAGRTDGMWVRSIGTVSAPPAGGLAGGLHFAIAGANPVGDTARLRFELAEAGTAAIEVYDVRGRRVGPVIRESYAAGPHEVTWSAQGLSPGVYAARLSVGAQHAVARIVHVR